MSSLAVHPERAEVLDRIREKLLSSQWEEAQSLSVEYLKSRKMDAQAWVFLAESLEHQGKRLEAWAAYERAWMLDPQANWVQPAKERLRIETLKGNVPEWLSRLLKVPDVSVAAAIIARNEVETIGEAVERVKRAVDKVIVIDTGSTDGTPDVAREAGAEVHLFEWSDDFSAARNAAHRYLDTEWVLWVDADELLDLEDTHVPRTVAGLFRDTNPAPIFRIVQVNEINGQIEPNYDMSRMYRLNDGLRWHGRIHEQICSEDGIWATNNPRPVVRIRVHHRGYEPDVMIKKRKLERNISLLKRAVEENPQDVMAWGFLGRDLYVAGRLDEAIPTLYQAELVAQQYPQYGRLPEIRSVLIEALIRLERLEEALLVAERLTKSDPDFPGGWYLKGRVELAIAVKRLEDSVTSFQKASETTRTYRGIVTYDSGIARYKAKVGLADALKLLGRWKEAARLYSEAKLSAPELKALDEQLNYLRRQSHEVTSILG